MNWLIQKLKTLAVIRDGARGGRGLSTGKDDKVDIKREKKRGVWGWTLLIVSSYLVTPVTAWRVGESEIGLGFKVCRRISRSPGGEEFTCLPCLPYL
jgi:hypothetical protein